jgi:hypothetical protein
MQFDFAHAGGDHQLEVAMRWYQLLSATVLVVATSALCAGQSVTSAKSGTLHYFQGNVSIDGAEVRVKAGIFPDVRPGSVLRTEKGRAELLLTPGVFLRVGDNSAIRMLDANLEHTRVEVVSGSAMVESDDPRMSVKNAPVTLVNGETEIRMVKHGLVEVDADYGQVRVFRGEAEVSAGGNHVILKEGNDSVLSGDLRAEKFDARAPDDLFIWSRDRSLDLTAANMYSAGAINAGPAGGYSSGAPWGGGWYYNSFFDSFAYVPAAGMLYNPWGYGIYSPGSIFGYGGPYFGVIGRPIGGNSNVTVGPSPITRLVGGNSGAPPVLGSPVRGGLAGARAAASGSGLAARSSTGGGLSGGGAHGGGGGGGAHGGGGHR